MDNELKETVHKFLDVFEQVFGKDWDYTKEMLGIHEETDEQRKNCLEMGLDLEPIYIISPDGTFLDPKVEDETSDWGYRGQLLIEYRKLKNLLSGS